MDVFQTNSLARGQAIPVVPGRPFIGNALEFWDQPLGFFVDAFHRYGPVFRFEVPMTKAVVVAGSLAREILQAGAGCPMDRKGLYRPFATEVGIDVFETEGVPHQRVRELLKLPYSKAIASQFAPEIEVIVDEIVVD